MSASDPHVIRNVEALREVVGHEIPGLAANNQAGLDEYANPSQLLDLFARMQAYQIRRASDPHRTGYRLRHDKPPADRDAAAEPRKIRRRKFLPDA